MKALGELARDLYTAKRAEDDAKKARIEIEAQIAAQVETPERGSVTVDAGYGLKVTVKRDLSYEADCMALVQALGERAPVEIIPAEQAFSPSLYEKLRKEDPAAFAKAAAFVTTKPRKVSVVLKMA